MLCAVPVIQTQLWARVVNYHGHAVERLDLKCHVGRLSANKTYYLLLVID